MPKRGANGGEGTSYDSEGSDPNSPGEEDGSTSSKKRRVVFDPIHLPGIHGVNDINVVVERAQLTKLAERLMLKNRLLVDEQRKNETLHLRQDRDDAIMCTLNRCWNQLDDELRSLIARYGEDEPKKEEMDIEEVDVSRYFLSELVEKDGEEADALCDRRVNATLNLVQTVMQKFQSLADQYHSFSKNLTQAFGSEEERRKTAAVSLVDAIKGAEELSRLTSMNAKLTREIDTVEQKSRENALAMRKLLDEANLKDTKIQELLQQLEDKQFELTKAWTREAKLEYRLAAVVKEGKSASASTPLAESAKTPRSGEGLRDMDDASAELIIQRELAANRLEEIKELSERVSKLASENEQLQAASLTEVVNTNLIMESKEYQQLKAHYSVLYSLYEKNLHDLDISNELRVLMEKNQTQAVVESDKEDKNVIFRLRQQITAQESELCRWQNDYEMLRLDLEQKLAERDSQTPSQHDLKVLTKSLQRQVHNYKQESAKYKKKWKEAVANVQDTIRQLEAEKKFQDQCVIIRINREEDGSLPLEAMPIPDGVPELQEYADRLRDEISKVQSEIKDLKKGGLYEDVDKLVPTPGNTDALREYVNRLQQTLIKLRGQYLMENEDRDMYAVIQDEFKLRLENRRLVETVRAIASKDWEEKTKVYAEDYERKLTDLEAQNERLRADYEHVKADEQTLMADMDNTGAALEDLQEQNMRLIQQMKEKEEQNLKMLTDRIMATQVETKLRAEQVLLVEKEKALSNMVTAQAQEVQNLKSASGLCPEILQAKDEQYEKVHRQFLLLQAKHMDAVQKLNDEKTRVQTLSLQIKTNMNQLQAKTGAYEKTAQSARRMQEELDVLKKRLERAKKYEQHDGNPEGVLLEEIREMKEQLTCPSCKTNPKDALLTKCFHVFCMKCIKTRYETRRRKCPKCNAGFGGNDYHRLYLT